MTYSCTSLSQTWLFRRTIELSLLSTYTGKYRNTSILTDIAEIWTHKLLIDNFMHVPLKFDARLNTEDFPRRNNKGDICLIILPTSVDPS